MKNNDFILLAAGYEDDLAAINLIGNDANIFRHKIPYAPPYENYDGIKKFQLKYYQLGMFCKDNVWAVVDITEWIGHEADEFFDITLKYFYDHRADLKYLFVANGFSREECIPVYVKLRCYMHGVMEENKAFDNALNLSMYLKENFSLIGNEALFLSKLLTEKEMQPIRNHAAIESLLMDIKSCSVNETISMHSISAYLQSRNSLIAMLSEEICEKYISLAARIDMQKTKAAG